MIINNETQMNYCHLSLYNSFWGLFALILPFDSSFTLYIGVKLVVKRCYNIIDTN